MQEEKQDLELGKFWARIFGGLGLCATGGVGMLSGTLVAFAFMLMKYRRGDEFDRAIDRVTSVQAGLFTIGMIIFQNLIAEMGWIPSEAIPVYAMPGFFILYKTMTAQLLRASLAEGKDSAGILALRA